MTLDTAKTAHGENLITDNLYIDRVGSYSDIVNSQLKGIIGDMADFIQFFKNVNYRDQDTNRQSIFVKYKRDIEHTEVEVDMLRNKLDKSAPNTLVTSQNIDDELPTKATTTVDTVII